MDIDSIVSQASSVTGGQLASTLGQFSGKVGSAVLVVNKAAGAVTKVGVVTDSLSSFDGTAGSANGIAATVLSNVSGLVKNAAASRVLSNLATVSGLLKDKLAANIPRQDYMMDLGGFQFGVSTAAYEELVRRTEFTWGSQERFGQLPALQFTGRGEETITLNGNIYCEFIQSTQQLMLLRQLGALGTPLMLSTGNGVIMGRFVIGSVEERQSVLTSVGQPRKQSFTLNLRRYDDGDIQDPAKRYR